jgi:membrane protein implicated in regulation of membrane protease activity
MACQFLLGLFGLGGHHDLGAGHDVGHDVHHEHGGEEAEHDQYMAWFMGVFTLRALVAGLTFFGLAGLAALQANVDSYLTIGIACAAAVGALFLVATMMRSLSKLRSDGTVRIDRAIGKSGTVYLNIPGQKSGVGKVHLNLQNRTVEYQAVTPNGDLTTGSKVVVVSVLGSDTVEVVSATDSGSTPHV